jgi:hypothetical protein
MEQTPADVARRETARVIKVFLFLLVLSIVLLVSAGYYIYANVDSRYVKETVERIAREEGGIDLTIGGLEYVYPSAVYMTDVKIKSPGGEEISFQKLESYLVLESIIAGRPTLRFVSFEDQGFLKIDFSAKLSKNPKPKMMMQVESYPITKLFKTEDGSELPILARVNGVGFLHLNRDGLEKSNGEFNFHFSALKFKEDAFRDTDAFIGKEKIRQAALENFNVGSAMCSVELTNGRIESKHCMAVTSFGDIELRFSEKMSSIIAKNPVQVDLLVWKPKDFLKLYFMFNSKSKVEKGFYQIPMIFTFAEFEETGASQPAD